MSEVRDSISDLAGSISELECLGLETPKLNELNDSYEVEIWWTILSRCCSWRTNRRPYSPIEQVL